MKSKVVYPSFRLMRRGSDKNNCVNTSIKPIMTGDKNLLFMVFVSFSTWQGFLFLENQGKFFSS